MNCERCHSSVIGFLERSLGAAERQEMEAHLRECSSCRGFLAYVQETFSAMESTRITEPDPFFYTRLTARMDREADQTNEKFRFVRILQPIAISVLLFAAIFTGIEIGNIGKSPEKNSFISDNLELQVNEIHSEPIETFFNEEL